MATDRSSAEQTEDICTDCGYTYHYCGSYIGGYLSLHSVLYI